MVGAKKNISYASTLGDSAVLVVEGVPTLVGLRAMERSPAAHLAADGHVLCGSCRSNASSVIKMSMWLAEINGVPSIIYQGCCSQCFARLRKRLQVENYARQAAREDAAAERSRRRRR